MLTRAMSLSSLPAASPAVALTGGEGALLERARLGDRGAFEQLYRQHCAHIYALCLRLTGQRELAEDCVQETFIAAWRALHSFRQRSGYATWLHRIAVNTVLSRQRYLAARDGDSGADSETDEAAASLDGAADPAATLDLERAIALLPPGARHALVLVGICGYSHLEASRLLGVATGTCKAQLSRARRLLAARLALPMESA
jgi:RNA polymerase sigma-70 factor (ECF subfamily)